MGKTARPMLVTILGWFLVISGLPGSVMTGLLSMTARFQEAVAVSGASLPLAIAWGVGSGLLNALTGVGLLKGKNWGRVMFVIMTVGSPLMRYLLWGSSVFDAGSNLRLGGMLRTVTFLILCVVLFVPPVSRFFSKGTVPETDN